MKIIRKTNFRLLVEPKSLGDYGSIRVSDTFFNKNAESIERQYMSRCKEIADQIKRHVDDVRSVDIDYDTEAVCSHCGYSWEVEEDGTPLCCNEAVKQFQESKSVSK